MCAKLLRGEHAGFRGVRMIESPKTVVAILHQGLGDVVMALPMLQCVDDGLPSGSTIHAVVSSRVEESVLRLTRLKSSLVAHHLGDRRDVAAKLESLLLALRLRALNADCLLAPHAPEGAAWATFARIVGAPRAIGPDGKWGRIGFTSTIRPEPHEHKAELFARFAREAGFPCDKVQIPNINMAQIDEVSRDFEMPGVGENWITIAPDSKTSKHKRWSTANYRALMARLLADDPSLHIGLIGAPTERVLLEQAAAEFDAARVRLFAHPSIPAALGVLKRARCHIGACSGALHLSTLVGTPIVGLYGPTNPDFTGPYRANTRIVRLGMACSPCYRAGFEEGCGTPLCMEHLEVEQVYRAVKDALTGMPVPEHTPIATTFAIRPSLL